MNNISENNAIKTYGDLSELERIREFIIVKASDFGFSEEISYKIALAVDEACSNLIKHSFKFDPSKIINIKVQTENNSFTVIISDNGSPFDPKIVPTPDMQEYFDHFKRGGLGVHIIRSVMDEIDYLTSNINGYNNQLILRKFSN